MRSPLYILSDTQMRRKIHGLCYESIETPEKEATDIVKTCVHRLINKA